MSVQSQHVVIYCNAILKTAAQVKTLVQHLCDMFQLMNKKIPETGNEHFIHCVPAVL